MRTTDDVLVDNANGLQPHLTPARYRLPGLPETTMGARRTPITVMKWQSDIREMKLAGTRVVWSCQACGKWGPVDLDPIAIAMGGWDMTLWDCYPPCEVGDCTGLVMFHASAGPGTPTRPMRSTTLEYDELPAAAWMAGWTGWHEFRRYDGRVRPRCAPR